MKDPKQQKLGCGRDYLLDANKEGQPKSSLGDANNYGSTWKWRSQHMMVTLGGKQRITTKREGCSLLLKGLQIRRV